MADSFESPDWSSLPCDLLIAFLRLLDAPSALAYSGVCAAWRAAAAAFAGVPLARTPWLFYWEPDWGYDEDHVEMGPLSATLRCLLGAGNASFPTAPFPRARARSLSCCGASHGWIIASDERSNLVLYNPFAPPSAANFIPLPPITDFECIRPGYSSDGEGRITAYVHNEYQGWGPEALGGSFYQKAILSCAPSPTSSNGAAYTAAVIHCESRSLSFAKAGDTEWREAWTLGEEETIRVPHSFWEDGVYITTNSRAYDEYCDVVHHDGRFYTVTKHGTVESWDLSGTNIEPGREVIGRQLGYARDEIVFFRHLVSTPWGDLLQIRVLRARNLEKYPQGVRVWIGKIIPTGHRMVELRPAKALRGYAMFLGLNHSVCVHPDEFPGLRPDCIYFTVSSFMEDSCPWFFGWSGVKIYNLKNNTAEDAFANFRGKDPRFPPPAVWIIQSHNRTEISFCCSLLNLSLGD